MKKVIIWLALLFSGIVFAVDTPTSLDGVKVVSAQEAKDLMSAGAKLYDVRGGTEYAEGHIKGAEHLPYKEKSKKEVGFDASADQFDDSKLPSAKMIFQCNGADCWKSYKASSWAMKKGKKEIYWFRGGFPEWEKAGFPVEK